MTKNKVLACILMLCLIMTTVISANADSYASDISSVMSTFSYQNIMSSSAPQQEVNGAYRMVELLEIMAKEKHCDSSKISDIMSTYSYQNIMASSAVQQLTNGT